MPSRRSWLLVIIASAALASLTPSGPAQRLIAPDTIISRIAKVKLFAFGGVGIALTISDGEMVYRELLSYPSAAADFERVFVQGTPQAKAYALVGLRQTNPKRFAELTVSLQTSTMLVQSGQGCIVFDVAMWELVNQIRTGLYSGPMTRNPITFP